MGKERSFLSKVSKAAGHGQKCPTCGEAISTVKVISSIKNDEKGSWRFKENFVAVCKCNEQEVYA
ncbi:hypothetical protein B6D60_11245 [candidate division KSB1 bacterium 4484_87]|nr:MAG: hypothetical protein B6D60_11245 [candidate division KSB1 bacterium 4484_87]